MWVAVLILTLLTLWITRLLTRTQIRPPLPPGPWGLPAFGNLLSLSSELHSYFATLARPYGPILSLRLGSKFAVVISSPSLAKEVLRDHDVTFASRDVPVAARAASYGGHDIPWSPYGPEWRLLRKVCVREMLCAATLDAVYGIRRGELRRTVRYIRSRVGSAVNLGEQMFLTSMNVVTEMSWGGGVAEEGEEERASRGREFRRVVAEITGHFAKPNISDFYPGLARFDLQGIEKKVKACAERFDGIFNKVIEQRMKMGGGGEEREKDFLEVLLKMKDEYEEVEDDGKSKVSFSMTHLKALLMDMVLGGTDTTSNTVEFAMAEIMNKPEVLRNVQEELDAVVGKESIVEEHHIHKLPYLQAVMKEAFRLHTVVPLLIRHCPSKSCVIGGYTIPKGTRIFINVWAMHRDPSIWANPLEFDPERFLNGKFDFSGNDFSYLPFGSGRRSCAGIAMAERMVLFSLASILHSFDWKLPGGEKLDLEEKFGIILTKRVPLTLIPEPRLSNPSLYE
ncbi:hypothetical protein Cgig2_011812 [Carnegiea gigantea]|uniref:Cytochrome P450 n=1 Tax=Carnegiea gigantea TaxID=171969 RepID=A0A9Q1Q905_9CARY|nr:hypothetical protein Cgig2_011812 [Carnegiea gigantea]